MGAPTKLTSELQAKIIQSLTRGMSVERTCLRHGICKQTFYTWLKKGAEGVEPFAGFFQLATSTRGEVEDDLLVLMHELARQKNDLKVAFNAAGWLLERCFKYYRPALKESLEEDESSNREPTSVVVVYEGLEAPGASSPN